MSGPCPLPSFLTRHGKYRAIISARFFTKKLPVCTAFHGHLLHTPGLTSVKGTAAQHSGATPSMYVAFFHYTNIYKTYVLLAVAFSRVLRLEENSKMKAGNSYIFGRKNLKSNIAWLITWRTRQPHLRNPPRTRKSLSRTFRMVLSFIMCVWND